ncbi:MAG: 6,7-dimethyl-8-ribityllumazine synthase [Bifidobacteriaceae bacterium]|jgi:6,7-dimethyl-8-ribityllumazine synthase|nr:6,7-dimethyl-8-ribityllumazine synthase [Bifidobacteriaceae bacterium]MCI1978816.1 6,7-dimethyl-8-ribityllumazine synthase [Bifidobacteriaceae bacterium]
MTTIQGRLDGTGLKVGIVVSRFNDFITSRLLEGALNELQRLGVAEGDCDVLWVPGAFEIPLAAKKMAASGRYDGLIALGAVIRGSTSHYDFVCQQVTSGIGRVQLDADMPVLFGVLTTDTVEQAIDRAGTKSGNKGAECAQGVIDQVDAFRQLEALKRAGEGR